VNKLMSVQSADVLTNVLPVDDEFMDEFMKALADDDEFMKALADDPLLIKVPADEEDGREDPFEDGEIEEEDGREDGREDPVEGVKDREALRNGEADDESAMDDEDKGPMDDVDEGPMDDEDGPKDDVEDADKDSLFWV